MKKNMNSLNTLESRFVLCAIESRLWSGIMTDRATSSEVTTAKNAANDAGKFMKVLVKSSALAKVRNAVNKARGALYSQSVPWLASTHLVAIERMEEIQNAITANRDEFDAAVSQFIEEYPKLLEGAAERLGKLFNAADYPTQDQLKTKFSLSATWLPINTVSADQMKLIDKSVAKEIEASASDAYKRAVADAHQEAISRAADMVDGVREALERYSKAETDGERAVMHTSRIESLLDAAQQLVDYTFPADSGHQARIEILSDDIREVASEGVDTLKESASARKAAADRLADIKTRLACMA